MARSPLDGGIGPPPAVPGGMQAALCQHIDSTVHDRPPSWTKGQPETYELINTPSKTPFSDLFNKEKTGTEDDGCRGRGDGGGGRVRTTPRHAKNTVCAELPSGCAPHRGLGHGDASMLTSFYRWPPCTQGRDGVRWVRRPPHRGVTGAAGPLCDIAPRASRIGV